MAHTGKLAPFKTVKKVEFVTEIPRNPSGKILKPRTPANASPNPPTEPAPHPWLTYTPQADASPPLSSSSSMSRAWAWLGSMRSRRA